MKDPRFDGRFGATVTKTASTASPIKNYKIPHPYWRVKRLSPHCGGMQFSFWGNKAQGDPGYVDGDEDPAGTGCRRNDNGHIECRNHNAKVELTLGPSWGVTNANLTRVSYGDSAFMGGAGIQVARKGTGGKGIPGNNPFTPQPGTTQISTDTNRADSSGGDFARLHGGSYGVVAARITMGSDGPTVSASGEGTTITAVKNVTTNSDTGALSFSGMSHIISAAVTTSSGAPSKGGYGALKVDFHAASHHINSFPPMPTRAVLVATGKPSGPGNMGDVFAPPRIEIA